MKSFRVIASSMLLAFLAIPLAHASVSGEPEPLVIGDTFTIESAVLSEVRRINVYMPPGYTPAGGGARGSQRDNNKTGTIRNSV